MDASGQRLLAKLAAAGRDEELRRLHADIAAMAPDAFVAACRAARKSPTSKRPVAGVRKTLAYGAADRARRKLLVKADRLVELLAQQIEADTNVAFSDVSQTDRRSMARFISLAAARAGDAAVIAAADALVRERSLASDVL